MRPIARSGLARAPPASADPCDSDEVQARKGRALFAAGHPGRHGPEAELLTVRCARAEERPADRTRLVISWP